MRLSYKIALPFITPFLLTGSVQKQDLQLPAEAETQRDQVVQIFNDSYSVYKAFAFGHDEVAPISKSTIDTRNGWGATIVDAMSTMQIMGLNDLFDEAVNFSIGIDFSKSKTPDQVDLFETTIRYVAGLLSAYQLSDNQHPALVDKARELVDKMVGIAWSQGQPIPFPFLDFENNTADKSATSSFSEAGSLAPEFYLLSQLTGNDTYRQLAENAVRHLISIDAPFPGLPKQFVNPADGSSLGGPISWGARGDSYFEYLIKYPRLTNTEDNLFADTWQLAVDSSIQHLLKHSTVGNHSYLVDLDDDLRVLNIGSNLACFYAGNWLLGGKLLNNQTIVDRALELNEGCWNTYEASPLGIGPELFAFISKEDGNFTGSSPPSDEQLAFYNTHGFYITDARYQSRPEVLESNFYAWRITGDTKYFDRAASMVQRFEQHLRVPSGGYAGLNDVTKGDFIDDTQSFWFAETLKYLYLTFDDPNHISLDDWVFNTEAHPFRAPPQKDVYGSGKLAQ